jgi:hypothetical protein
LGDEPKYTIDYLGDENANILTGTTKDEIFKSFKLSFRVLLPEPVMSITSMSWMRLSLILVKSKVKPVWVLGVPTQVNPMSSSVKLTLEP